MYIVNKKNNKTAVKQRFCSVLCIVWYWISNSF